MQPRRLGHTEGFAHKALQAGPERERFPCNLLRVSCANTRWVGIELTMVDVCPIRLALVHTPWCQQGFSLDEDVVLRGPQALCYDHAGVMSKGMPEPALVAWLPNDIPPRLDFRCFHWLDLHPNAAWRQLLDGAYGDVLERRRFV